MQQKYKIVSLVKDRSLKAALQKALSDDGVISRRDVELIIASTLDFSGVSHREFNELQVILRSAKTLDSCSKARLEQFLDNFEYYHHYLQHQSKKKAYSVPYSKDHIPLNTGKQSKTIRRPAHAMTPLYLTIHSTGNINSTAKNERSWLTNLSNKSFASYHLVVDEKEAIECIPLNESAWHAGDGVNGTGNRKTIGLEICESGDRAKTLQNAIALTSKILRDKSWGVDKLKQHNDWSGKNCPRILRDINSRSLPLQTWEWFKGEVHNQL